MNTWMNDEWMANEYMHEWINGWMNEFNNVNEFMSCMFMHVNAYTIGAGAITTVTKQPRPLPTQTKTCSSSQSDLVNFLNRKFDSFSLVKKFQKKSDWLIWPGQHFAGVGQQIRSRLHVGHGYPYSMVFYLKNTSFLKQNRVTSPGSPPYHLS